MLSTISSSFKKFLLLLNWILIFSLPSLRAQSWPYPAFPDTSQTGKNISRSLHLLATSTPEKRNTVKILVYGQSISAQDWWLEVKKFLQEKYPHANLLMENRSIGGYSSQLLYKTVEMDVCSFYPDLVLFHVYGNHYFYDTIVRTIRSRTTAEIALQTDHYTGANDWSDKMSFGFIPAYAKKYHCELIDIRTPWKNYDSIHQYEPRKLTSDGTHLNDHGNFLMAELIKPYLFYHPEYVPDPHGLVRDYLFEKDFRWKGDTILLPFQGNRVDIIWSNEHSSLSDSLKVFIDGKSPSGFPGTYYQSRPYSSKGTAWPWELPGMIRVSHKTSWTNEEWTCKFISAEIPYENFSFEISGSKTGPDGKGNSREDFISPSGKVILQKGDGTDQKEDPDGGDWNLKYSYQVKKTIVNPGDEIHWKTYSISHDVVAPSPASDPSVENSMILVQGIPNTRHELKLVCTGKKYPPIRAIRVYRPLEGRD